MTKLNQKCSIADEPGKGISRHGSETFRTVRTAGQPP